MEPLTLAMVIPLVLEVVGFKGNFNDLGESMQNQIYSMANTLMSKGNDQKADLFNAPSSSATQVKPNYEGAKKEIYQNLSNEYYKFQKDYEAAKARDEKSSRNNIITNLGGNIVSTAANIFGLGGKIRDKQAKGIYQGSQKVADQFAQKYNKAQQDLKQIDNKIINSHRQHINAANKQQVNNGGNK